MRLSSVSGLVLLGLGSLPLLSVAAPPPLQVKQTDETVQIETEALSATIRKKGYVSGVAAGTLIDKKTGAHDLGFGLHIMDFLLAPGWKDGDEYSREPKYHGKLAKHLIEGPQICTKARELPVEVIQGQDFVAVRLRHRFTQAMSGLQAGSTWEQTLVFQPGKRYFLSAERITSVNTVDE
jgi:hypothetical protein